MEETRIFHITRNNNFVYDTEIFAIVKLKDGFSTVDGIEKTEDGYFYFCFEDFCKLEQIASDDKFLRFIRNNEFNGWGIGSFESIEELAQEVNSEVGFTVENLMELIKEISK